MPCENSESGLSRGLVSVNPAIDRDEIFRAESSSECAEATRKLLCAAGVIGLSRANLAADHAGERAAQRIDSFYEFHCRVDIARPPPQRCFVEDEQCVARLLPQLSSSFANLRRHTAVRPRARPRVSPMRARIWDRAVSPPRVKQWREADCRRRAG